MFSLREVGMVLCEDEVECEVRLLDVDTNTPELRKELVDTGELTVVLVFLCFLVLVMIPDRAVTERLGDEI